MSNTYLKSDHFLGGQPQEVIAGPKLAAVQNAAIAACDKNDGVQDGIIDDPRTCTFNANANVCGQPGAPPAPACLTATEANAVNVMWDGPRNDSGKRIWFPIDRGTDFLFWDGNVPFALAPVQFGWDLENPAYYNAGVFPTSYPGFWGNVALSSTVSAPGTVTTYAAVAQAGSNNVADLTDTFDDLDAFKDSHGKMITVVGANDGLIMPRGVINYYRVMAARYEHRSDRYYGANATRNESLTAPLVRKLTGETCRTLSKLIPIIRPSITWLGSTPISAAKS